MLEYFTAKNVLAVIYVTLILIGTFGCMSGIQWSTGSNRFYIEKVWRPWVLMSLIFSGLALCVIGWTVITGGSLTISSKGQPTIDEMINRVDALEEQCK